jgi:transcription elongation factor B subunit 1
VHHPASANHARPPRRAIAAGGFIENEQGEIRFPDITTPVLEVVCKYFYYKLRYANTASKSIPEFKVAPEMALELLMAANYLDT